MDNKIRFYTPIPIFILGVCLFLGVIPVNSFAAVNETYQQAKIVKGVVKDGNGEPLPGVSISIKGTTNGTMTDVDGNYSLNVPDGNSTLVVSYVGFKTQEIKVSNQTTIDITLEELSKELDEVVVVGYGVQKKINLTGSVAAVQADKIENRAAPNLSTMLTGLASGVSVRQSSGNPGSDGANIRIRGIGTFDGSYRSPLVIIDGAVADMNSVNPEDVESVSLLKDAASASIYGSRGANGVILVTTKKGAKNAAPKVTYTGIFSQTKASRVFDFISDYADYMELYNMAEFSNNPKATSTYDSEEIAAWRAAKANPNGIYTDPDNGNQVPNYLAYPNTNWSDILFAPTYSQKHNLSVSGGSENSNYLLSLGYYDNPGTLENTGIDRFNARVNVESRITKFLKIGTQTYAMRQRKDPGNLDQVNTYRFQTVGGIVPYYDGKYGAPESPKEKNDVRNPLRDVNAIGGVNTTTRINTTWYAEAEIYKGLTGRASINYQNYFYDSKTYSRHLDSYTFRKGTILQPGTTLKDATTTRSYAKQEQYTANVTLNYNTKFAEAHDLGAMLGYEQFYFNKSGVKATKKGLLSFDVTDITTGSDMYEISGNPNESEDKNKPEMDYAMISYFGRLNYAYKGRYLFEANFRRDGSSLFSPDNRWGTFPSFSAGWRVSEESFFEPFNDKISNLKLRASWGRLGNATSGYYDWQAVYAKARYVFNNVISDGVAISKIANPLLKWESVTSKGIGLDASFLNSRLTAEFDIYDRLTEGILTSPAIYLTMGTASAPTKNTSDMRNNGLEVTLGWNDKIGNVRYAVSGNFSYNQNKVVKYLGKLEEGWVDKDGKRVYQSNIGEVTSAGSETGTLRVEGHIFDEYYLRTRYHGTGTYYNNDGSVNPQGGPKDGMIRSEADLKWVQDMIAAGNSFNGASVKQGEGLWYGEYIYADLNGDGNYGNNYDRQFTGKSSSPKYNFGLNLSAEWNGFDISMTWAGAGGFWYYLRERGANQNNLASKTDILPLDTQSKFYYLAYNKETSAPIWDDPRNNLTAEYARLRTGGNGPYAANDQYLYDATYLKLKMLQIGYTFPKAWTRKAYVNNLRIFVSGENLLTITKYPGVDPEIGGGLNIYPISRLLSLGVNVSF
ncbi:MULTISPECIES: TonB-dependent receptor [unclassified Dysgonomonas]|jgi:TonB-linked SusC/RagA family outer membrane protein|uniref:SusC/RagA family TonB-linked outer membrane protein n=1 Tax=unclassified Dysgonomonas TaxID=2630389 RepID=UPI0025BC0525|nr:MULTISPECIES: TonB-dependent receptor [unclassified Dysgonomonas]MDR2002172.1 TonB-dependent receptor [Prevotella sp.]HMM03417.1 TonB-dependent receptor [Dysgonomonas sp.]